MCRRLVSPAICTMWAETGTEEHCHACRQRMSVTKETVIEKLKTVRGPDFEGDIVGLGMVSDIFIANSKVFFSITVPAARAQELEPLRAAAERAVKAIPGVAGAVVALTAEKKGGGMEARVPPRARPAAPSAARARAAAGARLAQPRQARRAGRRGDHRRRLGQGRRRQIDHRRQSGARARSQRAAGRRARCRHLRPVDAEAARHLAASPQTGRRQDAQAAWRTTASRSCRWASWSTRTRR